MFFFQMAPTTLFATKLPHYRLLPRAAMGAEGQVDAQVEGPDVLKDPQSNGNDQSNSDGE